MKWLIINADDFGLNHDVNLGIMAAFEVGAITGTTLMVKRRGTAEAVDLSLRNRGLAVGLHLDLDDVLCSDAEGAERFSSKRLEAKLSDPSLLERVEAEIEEQIRYFKSTGLRLAHIDGHHHLHALPEIFPIVIDSMVRHDIRTVRVSSSYDLVKYPPIEWDTDFLTLMKSRLQKEGIKFADHFLPVLSSESLGSIPEGVTELMSHPGFGEEWRESELERLMSGEWKGGFKRDGINLISFFDLADQDF